MIEAFGKYGVVYIQLLGLLDRVINSEEAVAVRDELLSDPNVLFVMASYFSDNEIELTWNNVFFMYEHMRLFGVVTV